MPLEKWSDTLNIVHMADDPQFSEDLASLDGQLSTKSADVVLDLSAVKYINSSNISQLLKLRKKIIANKSRMILCGVNALVWGTFLVTGLDKVFQFSDNVPTALATLQMA